MLWFASGAEELDFSARARLKRLVVLFCSCGMSISDFRFLTFLFLFYFHIHWRVLGLHFLGLHLLDWLQTLFLFYAYSFHGR